MSEEVEKVHAPGGCKRSKGWDEGEDNLRLYLLAVCHKTGFSLSHTSSPA